MSRILRLFLAFQLFCLPPLYSLAQVATKYTVPAEWRIDQTGTWLGWPKFQFDPNQSTVPQLLDMMSYITDGSKAFVAVDGAAEANAAKLAISTYNKNHPNRPIVEKNVSFHNIPRTDFWMRDYLLFAHDRAGTLSVIDFNFNEWGMGHPSVSLYFQAASKTDTNIPEKIAPILDKQNVKSWLVMEPGGLEFNDGSSKTLIVSEAVVLQPERNPGITKQQAHDELMRVFALDKIIWLPKFKYENGKEVMIPQCPIPATNNPQDKCNDASSDYYTTAASGGVVADDSTYYGPLPNPQSREEREYLGRLDQQYDNVLTPLTTNGHTDEFVRWVGPNTVLLAENKEGATAPLGSISNRTNQRLEAIKKVLIDNGIPERNIIRVPTPKEKVYYLGSGGTYDGILDMMFTAGKASVNGVTKNLAGTRVLDLYDGDAAFLTARSYLNYVVTNKYVLIPKYEDGSDDAGALKAFKAAFEGKNATGRSRTVIQIKGVDNVNIGGGGMHCITQNQPIEQ